MKKGKVTGCLKKPNIEEATVSYSMLRIIGLIKSICISWSGEYSYAWEKKRNAYKFLVVKRSGKRSLRRPGLRREAYILIIFNEI